MEFGLWRYLLDIKTNYLDPSLGGKIKENREIDLPSLLELPIQHLLMQKLRHCTGEAFSEVVMSNFSVDQMHKDENDASLDVQQVVVKRLRQCRD